jgi:Tfp pilus tip-associated adhesin PilY1
MAFHTAQANRQSVLFAGSLDGMLHAFDAGKFRRDDNPQTIAITETRGYFLWEDRTVDPPAYCSAAPAACPNYGTGEELWAFIPANLLPRLKNNVLQGEDRAYVDASPALADVYVNGAWRTVLISAEGVGGDTIFCLDVTDPYNPTFLWEFADPDLFRSRSSPSIAKIGRVLMDGSAKWVAFFVSGKTYDATLYPSIYMIDIEDGSVVERIFLNAEPSGIGAVPSGQPTVIDSDANGYADKLYIGSDKGFLYKVNIPDDPDTVKYGTSTCLINTDFTDENSNTVAIDQRNHPIYGSPVAIVDNSISDTGTIEYDIRIFFGTGDSPYYDEDINMAATRYHFFAYRDQTPKGECDHNKVFLDWQLELPEGHRIYSSAFAAAGNIYFGTSTAETEDPCEVSNNTALYGLGRIYSFTFDGTEVAPPKEVGNSFVSPMVIDQHLYFKSQTAEIESFGSGIYNNRTAISGFPEVDLKYWREIY